MNVGQVIANHPATRKCLEKHLSEIKAAYERSKPLKPLPTLNVPDEPWPHSCATEPCPTCDLHAWLKAEVRKGEQ